MHDCTDVLSPQFFFAENMPYAAFEASVFFMRIYDWNRTGKRQTLEAAAGRAANWEARALFETAYTKSERELMKEVRQERKYCFCLDAFARLKTNLLYLALSKCKGLGAASPRALFLSQRTRMLNAFTPADLKTLSPNCSARFLSRMLPFTTRVHEYVFLTVCAAYAIISRSSVSWVRLKVAAVIIALQSVS